MPPFVEPVAGIEPTHAEGGRRANLAGFIGHGQRAGGRDQNFHARMRNGPHAQRSRPSVERIILSRSILADFCVVRSGPNEVPT